MSEDKATSPLHLSVLDQSPVAAGSTGAQALRNTIDLARLADELGYHRYWLAEHHGTQMLAGASPEVLIGPVASATSRIRVGSGGVTMHHYSPRKVAESFSVLSGLYPGRIDLAVGRGMSGDAATTFALQRDRRQPAPDDFADQLEELLAYLEERPPADRRLSGLAPLTGLPGRPEPWLLGSSLASATWAGQRGLPYAFGDFINPQGAEMARLYREFFTGSAHLPAPRLAVAVSAVCAETDARAEELAASGRMCAAVARDGRSIPVPPVEEAVTWLSKHEPANGANPRRSIVGSPDTVRLGIDQVAREYEAEEVILVTISHSHADRRRSYELIAEAFAA